MAVNRGDKGRAVGLGCLLWLGVMWLLIFAPALLTRSMPVRMGLGAGVFVIVAIVRATSWKRIENWMYGGDVRAGKILDAYDYLQSLGFFAQYASVPEEQVLSVLRKGLVGEWGTDEFPSRTEYYGPVLSLDTNRTWYYRSEDDDEAPEIEYIEALKGLAAISRGVFRPEAITATYQEQEDEVTLSFTIDGAEQSFTLENCEWFETDLVAKVNGLIHPSGHRFYMCFENGLTFVLMLSDAEAESIKSGRRLTLIEGA